MTSKLVVQGAREHNLRNVDVVLPRDKLIVFTGLSGSGKSSLAFDTIYAEGQRRYVESLSAYARQFLGQMDKPDVDFIEGLSPAISIDQKSASRNPRSTVGTITEVYDYLRLLYARIGIPHDPETGEQLIRQTPQQIVDRILELPEGTRFQVLAPVVRGRKGTYDTLLADLASKGFQRARSTVSRRAPRARRHPPSGARPRSRPLRDAHDQGRRRPPRAPRGHRAPPHRVDGDRAVVGRRRRRDRDRPQRRRSHREHRVQPAPRPPERRQVVRGARAPQLLVQLALRRVRALRRSRHGVRGRPRARRAQPRPHHRRGRDRAVVERAQPVLPPAARGGGRRLGVDVDTPCAKLPKAAQKVFLYGG